MAQRVSRAVGTCSSATTGSSGRASGLDASLLITGAVQGDDTFAVPGAQGCGPNGDGSLDAVVNAVVGLPSPAGSNHLVLDDAASGLGFTAAFLSGQETRTGQQFAADWHVGFGP